MRLHWDESISGWISDFRPVADQLRVHGERLIGLVGQRLVDGWTGWNTGRNVQQLEIPPVLVFEGGDQLELNWDIVRDDISITWNTIDLSFPPTTMGIVHEWRRAKPPPLAEVIGRRLTGFAMLETPFFRGEDIEGIDFDDWPLTHAAGWEITGLWLAFGDKGLRVISTASGASLYGDLGRTDWCRPTVWPPSTEPATDPRRGT